MIKEKIFNIGLSGAKIYLIFKNGKTVIRKQSFNKKVSLRLKEQYEKILSFQDTRIQKIKILDSGYKNKLFYYDMDFINGQTLESFIIKKPLNFTLSVIDNLIIYIQKNKQRKFYNNKTDKKFNLKINELEKIIIQNKKIKHLKNKFTILKKTNWDNFPLSENHGDLSLENILINRRKKIFFIDMSKNFVDSYLLDVSKLIFDLVFFWSIKKNQGDALKFVNYKFKYDYIKSYVISKFKLILTKEEFEFVKKLLILDILRVLPYIKNKQLQKKLTKNLLSLNI